DRVTDAYINDAMPLDRYKLEMGKVQSQQQELERARQEMDRKAKNEQDSQSALEGIEHFCAKVNRNLETLTFDERQQLLRLLVESVRVEDNLVTVETIIPTDSGSGELRTRHPELVEGWEEESGFFGRYGPSE
ncbi:MAG: hypothetical protein IIC27_00290, partial [Chloroflexi bacterium]|nr:hypothetical protein [Chloroflexota bacterium]